ncbi:DUF1642 domain-containing protein [Streptococcus pneumoniae]|uniref:DUF1642 domain-containing protein n=1 Tax=Streptococcus pneumoniae TaxID=1313 RepID=UPI001C5F3896|nr:DUF1642 domain-containing protein [Streptococcus pneumoniae]MBW5072682.1 DUF1642 domain-containing protein [Streptococcus pneumoniae]MDG7270254.1 DUF1642 domain-containing protein [Streptococcus pneumoniae]MDG7552892.1 DUF1642 domain-containing protein [Streptococcus pneumoniae]MDG7619648.1 DUF1642 domain-containing protein [Streptococcus pneumoniae]
MNKDLIETPRFNFFIGDEVLLKGKIVGFDVDENKCVENVVRLEYGQTLNVPNNNIYITDDIVDKSKIKVVVPQFVAEHIEHSKGIGRDLQDAMNSSLINKQVDQWLYTKNNMETFALAWIFGYEVEEEKRYTVVTKVTKQPLYYNAMDKKLFFSMGGLATKFTRKQLEEAGVGWVFDCPGIEIEEVE